MKSAHKKKKESRNQKIGHVRRSLEKKFEQSESERLLHRAIWYLQVGFFSPLHLLFKLRRLQFGGSGEKTSGPQFSFPFFSLTKYTKILFSLLFFSIILKIHPTKQTSLEKSSISLY